MKMIECNFSIFDSSFSLNDDFYYIIFMSKDKILSNIISEKFNKKFNIIDNFSQIDLSQCNALLIGKVFTLFIKKESYDILSESLLQSSLLKLKEICNSDGIKELHLSKLNLTDTEYTIFKSKLFSVFNDTDITFILFSF